MSGVMRCFRAFCGALETFCVCVSGPFVLYLRPCVVFRALRVVSGPLVMYSRLLFWSFRTFCVVFKPFCVVYQAFCVVLRAFCVVLESILCGFVAFRSGPVIHARTKHIMLVRGGIIHAVGLFPGL